MTDGDDVVTGAEEALASIGERVDDEGDDGTRSNFEAVATALDEAEDALTAIDYPALLDAVDEEKLLEAIDAGEVPAALTGDEHADVVALRDVVKAVELTKLLRAVDVTSLIESVRAVDEATDELTGSGGGSSKDDTDGGPIEALASAIGAEGDEDGDLIETGVGDLAEVAEAELKSEADLLAEGDLSAYQSVIQQGAIQGVDAFRDALLQTHGAFERVVEENRERTRTLDRHPDSRNPTAASTIPGSRGDLGSTPNYATMPRTVRHADAPTRSHIYGDRFRRERERRGYE